MAIVKGPLFSLAATGKFNNLLEFRTGSGKTTVHGIRSCPATRSQAQQAQALRFSQAVSGWQALSVLQKSAWRAAAVGAACAAPPRCCSLSTPLVPPLCFPLTPPHTAGPPPPPPPPMMLKSAMLPPPPMGACAPPPGPTP